ncbi:MAG: tetratricopeptide repeat protein [Thermodesulfobacteriota bacterium]|nr:tetratricopeptide repeat protein [Thermodesulfobacteriota bacterium]
MKSNLKFHLIAITLITVIGIGLYANTFKNEFTNWDDGMCYARRQLTLASVYETFKIEGGGTYQPLRELSYAVDYCLWKKNPFGYHLQNILWYILGCIVIYFLAILLYSQLSSLKGNTAIYGIALICALIFCAHPLHVEVVAWMAARKFVLLGFFFFLSFFFYIKSGESSKNVSKIFLYGCSFVSFILALLSQPNAVVFPFLLFLYEVCNRRSFNLTESLRIFLLHLPFWLPTFLIAFYFAFFCNVVYSEHPYGGFYSTFLNIFKIIFLYFKLFIAPLGLSARYILQNPASVFEVSILFSLLFTLGIITFAVGLRKKHSIITFSVLWILISLVPTLNIIPISTLMADRYAFLASFGFFIFFPISLIILFEMLPFDFTRKNRINISLTILLFFGLLCAYLTIFRNQVWKNSETLWTDTARKYPSNVAFMNLGEYHLEKGLYDRAIEEFKVAYSLSPDEYQPLYNIGLAYLKKEHYDQAIFVLEDVISKDMSYTKAYSTLGVAYLEKGNIRKAIECENKAMELEPDFPDPYINMGNIYMALDDLNKAGSFYQKALALNPFDRDIYYNLGTMHCKRKEYDLGIGQFKKALEIDRSSPEIYNNLGSAFFCQGKYGKALENYRKAFSLSQNNPSILQNLGNTFFKIKDYKNALLYFNKALLNTSDFNQIQNIKEFITSIQTETGRNSR